MPPSSTSGRRGSAADPFDLLVVGGGVNGCGIARDAAGRGLSVMLVERDDLAGATSSASTKLIHGGLRYLEHFEFSLVRESLQERERLLANAPHIVRPMSFVLPARDTARPAWMIRVGLFLYDHLARHPRLPNSTRIDLKGHPWGAPLRDPGRAAFCYADCQVDDARLVVVNAIAAAEAGAVVATRTELIAAERSGQLWAVQVQNGAGFSTLHARALVNAAGPWVAELLERIAGVRTRKQVRLVRGSHIVVPRIHPGDQAYLLQVADGRVVFVLPYLNHYTLVGTTEVDVADADTVGGPSPEERDYLFGVVNDYFRTAIGPDDVIWQFSGVRPLFGDMAKDTSAVTRDYELELDDGGNVAAAPLLSVFGGKLTTFRRLSETVVSRLSPFFPQTGAPWTAMSVLPGGDLESGGMEALNAALQRAYRNIDPDLLAAVAGRHGSRAQEVLAKAETMSDLGELFAPTLCAREVDYLIAREWACTADDILWRRTKVGLTIDARGRTALESYLEERTTDDRA
jgi:glycerol-3-phosphate dehydrogenase